MMKTENYIKWLIFAFLSLFLVACKPTADFIYTPSAPSTGEVVKFDASKSSVYKAKEGNAISVYAWDFGDGSQGTGQTTEHTYTTAGKYVIKLSVTDLAGQTSATTQKITVKQGTNNISQNVTALVQTVDGATIPNATVTIQGQTVQTDNNGLANIQVTLPQNTKQVVVKFEKSGFITQSIVYDVATLKSVSANLLAIKQSVPVADITQAQVIEAQYLNASITIPANAFVRADGSAATGAVTVKFTPWDITNSDLNAMPANGVAQDAQSNIVNLISAGMITAIFKDANGQELQLAKGKTADIQMNLPLKSINNQEMKVGTEIPMWHFDESKGLWIEEGVGHVVASSQSSTGLAVHATVSHFSTWNWDFKFANAGSVFVQCQQNGVGVPCNVIAKVTLNDNSSLIKSNELPTEGLTVINMPSSGSIYWSATDITGTMIGDKTSATSGNVIIELSPPTTDNFVKCTLANGTAVECSGKMNNAFDFSVSKDGGRYITGIKDLDGQLDWTGHTGLIHEGNAWVRYSGKAISGLNSVVNITLSDREVVYADDQGLSFTTVCTSYDYDNQGTSSPVVDWDVDPILTGKPCKITVSVSMIDGTFEDFEFSSVYGKPVKIQLPGGFTGFDNEGKGPITSIYFEGAVKIKAGFIYIGGNGLESAPEENAVQPLYMDERCVEENGALCPLA